jgi:hypothetical protein
MASISLVRSRAIGLLAFFFIATAAYSQQGIDVTTFPYRSVADGRSTATVTATVRDSNGRLVQDGTRVVFTTTLGTFREPVISTSNGIARAVLVAGGTAGVAKITVNSLSGNAPPTTREFEFVSDRKLLSSAQEYVEIVTNGTMQFTGDSHFIAASAPDYGVKIRYRDIQVAADDIQLDVSGYVLRARKARVKFGKINQVFEELFLKFNDRSGFGTTTYSATAFDTVGLWGRIPAFLAQDTDGEYRAATASEKFGLVSFRGGSITPTETTANRSSFEFRDLSESPSTIRAKKAVVFPQKGIQFQKADVYVGETRIMKMPLYELKLNDSRSPLVTDQFVSIRDNQLAVNYPYYMDIRPGQSSLFRLRTGEQLGRSTSASRGVFLDYEWNWNRGDEMEGGLNLSGIGRDDWMMGLRQTWQLDPATNAYIQAQSPAGQSIFGAFGLTKQFTGFQTSFNGNMTQGLRGLRYTTQDVYLSVEKDPTKLGRLPVQLYVGLTTFQSKNSLINATQRSTGVYGRFQSSSLRLDSRSSLVGSFEIKRLTGTGSQNGINLRGSASLSRKLSSSATLVTTYDYYKDNFNDKVFGNHSLSFSGFYNSGRTNFSFSGLRSLDRDRASFYGDASYTISPLWRLGYSYTWDRFLDSRYLDYNTVIGYRVGWREVGLTWSLRTHRIGFQVLGTVVY